MDNHEISTDFIDAFKQVSQSLEKTFHIVANELIQHYLSYEEMLREKYFSSGGRYGKNEDGFLRWKEVHVNGLLINDPLSEGYVHKW